MKIQHVTILTRNFEEEIRFYEEFAGLEVVQDARPHMDLVFLSNGQGETRVEIIRNPEAEESGSQYISIGFGTDDAEALREEYIARGLETTELISPNPSVKFFYVKDPAGVRVQFVEG
ncbi:MAG: VOC family protein [Firmicutes bacterium]|nr:VOC family protein [Bacillota bacterium]